MLDSGWQCIVVLVFFFSIANCSGLYKVSDNVTIFNTNNIVSTVSNSSTLWLVEYYLEWCGHCQDFAPTYKQLANDVKDWFPVLQVGAINCADVINSKFCTKQNITGVPALRLYSPDSNLINGDGSIFEAKEREIKHLREKLIMEIENNINSVQWRHNRPKPSFSPPSYSFVVDLIHKKKTFPVNYFAFVFEKNSSVVGKEVILDMSSCSNINVRRIVSDSSDGVALLNKLRLRRDVPFVVVISSRGNLFAINRNNKPRSEFVKQLRSLAGVEEMKNIFQLASPEISDRRSQINIDYRAVKRDQVYLADIESGLRYIFTIEVASHKELSGSKLEALKMMLKLLSDVGNHFPARPSTSKFLRNLYKWIKPKKLVLGSEWLRKIEEKQDTSYLPETNKLWVGCLGSAPKLRGYPCSLWTIFHALSVAIFKANLDEGLLPDTMHNYIKNFFGCLGCRNNFEKEIVDLPFKQSDSPHDAILWLWKMHNKVNKRLHSTSSSEDPAFPKIIFPPRPMCPRCWADVPQGDLRPQTGEIARFLVRRFAADAVSWEYLNDDAAHDAGGKSRLGFPGKPISNDIENSRRFFSKLGSRLGRQQHNIELQPTFDQLDFNLCMLVWFVSAGIVIGLIVAFHTRARWLKQIKSSRHVL